MTTQEKLRLKLKFRITSVLSYISMGLFLLFFFSIIIIDLPVLKKLIINERLFNYIIIFIMFVPMIIGLFAHIYRDILQQEREKYAFKLFETRSATNIRKGLIWLREGKFKKALDVYDTIKDKDARSFYYHLLLFTAKYECKEDEFREACINAINLTISTYTMSDE